MYSEHAGLAKESFEKRVSIHLQVRRYIAQDLRERPHTEGNMVGNGGVVFGAFDTRGEAHMTSVWRVTA